MTTYGVRHDGLIAFYNEKIVVDVDGLRLPQARTHFFK